jgi:hypothetical protein
MKKVFALMTVLAAMTLSSCSGCSSEPTVADEKAELEEELKLGWSEVDDEVGDLMKTYNENMDAHSRDGMISLGMGFQNGNVLLNYTVDDTKFDLGDLESLKAAMTDSIKQMPTQEKEDMQCIPNAGYKIIYTFVGKKSAAIVSFIFTVEELQELLY